MTSENREIFARLLALSAIREAQIKANPIPFLNALATQNANLRRAAEEAIYHLSGAGSMDVAAEIAPKLHPSIVETAVERNRRASKTLATALRALSEKQG